MQSRAALAFDKLLAELKQRKLELQHV